MSLREAAQQALEFVTSKQWGTTPYMDVRVYEDAARLRDALRAALAQQAEPVTFNEVDEQSRKVHAHLAKALRIPEMPWPDPHAHGHEAAARAIHTSYCAIRFELMDALARLTTLRATVAKAFAALAQQEQEQADPTDPGYEVEVLREHVRHLERRVRELHAQPEQEQADYPEEKLQAVAEYVSNQYHVWYGVNARDIEEVLRQSVRCGLVSNPPRRETEQEPVALPCCGYTDASAIKWNRFNGVVQCHNCGQVYTHPPRREWASLTPDAVFASDEIMAANASLGLRIDQLMDLVHAVEQALKEKNHG